MYIYMYIYKKRSYIYVHIYCIYIHVYIYVYFVLTTTNHPTVACRGVSRWETGSKNTIQHWKRRERKNNKEN